MPGAVAAKTSKDKKAGQVQKPGPAASPMAPTNGHHADILGLQQTVGNQAVGKAIQPLRTNSPTIPNGLPHGVENVLRSGGGQPLDPATRSFMESRFGHDFSQVRIHTNSRAAESAQAVNAFAYTVGKDIAFDAGKYAPKTSPGKGLLAHELAHVVQQERGGGPPTLAQGNALDQSADWAASTVAHGNGPVKVSGASAPSLARQKQPGSSLASQKFQAGQVVELKLNVLLMPADIVGKKRGRQVAHLKKGDLLRLGDLHPQGGGKVFYATVIKTSDKKYKDGDVGIVRIDWIRPSAEGSTQWTRGPFEASNLYQPGAEFEFELEPGGKEINITGGLPHLHLDYIDKQAEAVGVGILLGGAVVFCKDLPNPVFVPQAWINTAMASATSLDQAVRPDRIEAQKALKAVPVTPPSSRYAYYRGYGNRLIVPTIFSPASTPRIITAYLDAIQQLAEEAKQLFSFFAISLATAGIVKVGINAVGWLGRKIGGKFAEKLERLLTQKKSKPAKKGKPEADQTKQKRGRPEEPRKHAEKQSPKIVQSLKERARKLVEKVRKQYGEVVVNLGGMGRRHEPEGAINVNNLTSDTVKDPQKTVPNLIKADASEIGNIFPKNSVDRIVSFHVEAGRIKWNQTARGAHKIMKPGGTIAIVQHGGTQVDDIIAALKEAGFKGVGRSKGTKLVTGTR